MIFTGTLWWQLGTLAAGALLTALVLAVEHWFPWVQRLPRVQAYVWGVAAILLGFTVWRVLNHDWQTPAGLLIITVVGGVTVVGAYRIDGMVRLARQGHKAAGCDDELIEE